MEVKEEKKLEILLNAFQEKNNSIHIIRGRAETISLWILGLLTGASGWLFQANNSLDNGRKIIILMFLLLVWFALKYLYFSDLEKGFNGQRKVLSKIEDSLGFYTENYFNNAENTLYPNNWKITNQQNGEGKFFENTYNLIAISVFILAVSVFISN